MKQNNKDLPKQAYDRANERKLLTMGLRALEDHFRSVQLQKDLARELDINWVVVE